MSTLLSLFQNQVDNLLSADSTELSAVARIEQIKAAVERFSQDVPDTRTEDVTGDAGRYYALATALDQWAEGFSRVHEIEYPAADVSSDETPVYLEPEDWRDDYWAEAASVQTRYLYLPSHAPAATESMRIKYTVPYSWSASSSTTAVNQVAHAFSVNDFVYLSGSTWILAADSRRATHQVSVVTDVDNFTAAALQTTVPTQDFFAVCHLAAGYCCQAIGVKYASSSDSTIGADSTAHSTRSSEFATRAKELIGLYDRHVGRSSEQGQAPGIAEFVDWDTEPGWPGGRQYVFHGRGIR